MRNIEPTAPKALKLATPHFLHRQFAKQGKAVRTKKKKHPQRGLQLVLAFQRTLWRASAERPRTPLWLLSEISQK